MDIKGGLWGIICFRMGYAFIISSFSWVKGDDIGIVHSGVGSGNSWAGGPVTADISVHSALVVE
jgi:hypothetical protein